MVPTCCCSCSATWPSWAADTVMVPGAAPPPDTARPAPAPAPTLLLVLT